MPMRPSPRVRPLSQERLGADSPDVNRPIVARHEIKPQNLVERRCKPPILLGGS